MIQALPGTSTSRRLKALILSWELFRDFLTAGTHPARSYEVVDEAIPARAALLNVRYAWPNCIELLLHSDDWDEVEEGAPIPYIKPIMLIRDAAKPTPL